MRPTRLELAGFGSWVDPTIIDFTDADLFALTGDTGAGKSTVLDAISFALYGKAPRHGKRDVEPLINRGSNEAKVRLDFVLDGTPLTATRVLRRRKDGGANTTEARLERLVTTTDGDRDTETIVSGANEVTAEVERRIGLTWDHFTTAVILPQGRFQEFLLATPSDRQDLLNELLRLGVFEAIKQRAGQRAREHAAQATAVDTQLEGLANATPDAITDTDKRIGVLDDLLAHREEVTQALDAMRDEVQTVKSSRRVLEQRVGTLTDLHVPERLDELAGAVDAARTAHDTARASLDEAQAARDEATKAREALPETSAIRALLDEHESRAALSTDLEEAAEEHAAATTAATAAGAELAAAKERVHQARAALDEATRHDHAASAAEGLAAGDPCPVCGRDLEDDPRLTSVDVAAARKALAAREGEANELDTATRQAEGRVVSAHATLEALRKQSEELTGRISKRTTELGASADRDGVVAMLERASSADSALAESNRALDAARDGEKQAALGVETATAAMQELDERLRETTAGLRALELDPPTVDHADLAAAWRQLVDWAQSVLPNEQQRADQVDQQLQAITERGKELKAEFIARAAECGVTVDPSSKTFDEVPTARAQQQAHLDRLRADLERAQQLRDQVRDHRTQQALAEALADTLRANKLEQWLLSRVLKQLVVGASATFHDLSAGAYSLRLDEGTTVEVVDHANADLARSVQSLSGGETFLASLALALALADQVAGLATDGAARLDALFIDEGFGTLDAETLDTVAAALQALGESGRMIGVVTHVRDLAEQLPLRFEVTRIGRASHVRRSDEDAS